MSVGQLSVGRGVGGGGGCDVLEGGGGVDGGEGVPRVDCGQRAGG